MIKHFLDDLKQWCTMSIQSATSGQWTAHNVRQENTTNMMYEILSLGSCLIYLFALGLVLNGAYLQVQAGRYH